jgi:hypothetical protein
VTVTSHATPREAAGTHFVHLCSGEVIELSPVTSIRVTASAVLALNGATVVASYPRSAVYFVADQAMEPPSLN